MEKNDNATEKRDVLFYLDSLNHYLNGNHLRIATLQEKYDNEHPEKSKIVLELQWV